MFTRTQWAAHCQAVWIQYTPHPPALLCLRLSPVAARRCERQGNPREQALLRRCIKALCLTQPLPYPHAGDCAHAYAHATACSAALAWGHARATIRTMLHAFGHGKAHRAQGGPHRPQGTGLGRSAAYASGVISFVLLLAALALRVRVRMHRQR